jgi:hypothetical protein
LGYMPKRVLDLLACWKGSFGRHCSVDLWGTIPLCIIWIIWRECNQHTFEGIECSDKTDFLCSMYDWMPAFSGHSFSSLEEFPDICYFR